MTLTAVPADRPATGRGRRGSRPTVPQDARRSASRDAYVDAMAELPGGVTIVTGAGRDGRPVGMTTTSAVGVSADPPMLAVAMTTGTRTASAVADTARFCVNVVAPGARSTAALFASRVDDKFRDLAWEPGPSGTPWLPGTAVRGLHCSVVECVPAGDHLLVVGRVDEITRTDHDAAPGGLVYYRRGYRSVGLPAPGHDDAEGRCAR